MRQKKSFALVTIELAAVLLVTVFTFALGVRVAQTEWDRRTIGGEHLFLLTPPVYYIVKQMAMDWIADIRAKWNVR